MVGRELEREVLPYCAYAGLGVLPYGPLGGGLLTGKYRRGETPGDGTRAGGEGLSSEGMSRRMTPGPSRPPMWSARSPLSAAGPPRRWP